MREGSFRIHAGNLSREYSRLVTLATKKEAAGQIMNRRPAVYTKSRALRRLIANRLGWVDIATTMQRRVTEIEKFGNGVIRDGLRQVVLMGMGGSSLCPEVFKLFNHKHSKLKSFDVLDSTDPAAVRAMLRKLDLKKSFFNA
jgi:glucose-6-phosphate isomerase